MSVPVTYEKLRTVTDNAEYIEIIVPVDKSGKFKLLKANGNAIHVKSDSPSPNFLPDNRNGKQIRLRINLTTGVVQEWSEPSSNVLQLWIDAP